MSTKGKAKNNARVALKREVDETLAKLDLQPRLLTQAEIGDLLSVRGPALAHALDYLATTGIIDPHVYVARNQQHRARQEAEQKRRQQNGGLLGDDLFRKACELAGTPVTRRQASKFLRRRGVANAHRFDAARALEPVAA